MRTLESLFWMGVRLIRGELKAAVMSSGGILLETWDWRRLSEEGLLPTAREVWAALAALPQGVEGETRILIAPGYGFRVCDALITNFHQPRSTLLLLIAAFTGGDFWRRIYQEALAQDYRFLSYGDSSLLWRG